MPNQFVKLLISFSFLLIFVIGIFAQEKCDLTSPPKLLNLNLGMTSAEVKRVFGNDLSIKIKNKGERTFFQNYIDKPAKNSLLGIRALYLRFYNDRLYQIEIFYENRNDWQTLAGFTESLSAQINFTANNWQIKQNKALIDCQNFSVFATNILNPRVELTDEVIKKEVLQLRNKK